MTIDPATDGDAAPRGKRADARRNEEALLQAAAQVFVASGVNAPVRDIASLAGVGVGTIYRHFPTRADLVSAVYRHQVEACAAAGPVLLEKHEPFEALAEWIELFVEFLITKRGLPEALQSDQATFEALHKYFLERLLPVVTDLLLACKASGALHTDIEAYELLRGVGNLCMGAEADPAYDPRRPISLLLRGLHK